MLDDRDSARIVDALIGLGANLGLGVVAEGVESAAQATALRELRRPLAQGHRFGKPVKDDVRVPASVAPTVPQPRDHSPRAPRPRGGVRP